MPLQDAILRATVNPARAIHKYPELGTLAEGRIADIAVYRDDTDHIIGILHARDLIPLMQHPELIVLTDIIRPAHFVPWMK